MKRLSGNIHRSHSVRNARVNRDFPLCSFPIIFYSRGLSLFKRRQKLYLVPLPRTMSHRHSRHSLQPCSHYDVDACPVTCSALTVIDPLVPPVELVCWLMITLISPAERWRGSGLRQGSIGLQQSIPNGPKTRGSSPGDVGDISLDDPPRKMVKSDSEGVTPTRFIRISATESTGIIAS